MVNDSTTRDVAGVFVAIDALDASAVASYFADDATVIFANNPSLVGSEQIGVGLAGLFASVRGLEHEILRTWSSDRTTVFEAAVTYTRLDGREVTLPAITIVETNVGGLISDYRVLVDLAPVYAD